MKVIRSIKQMSRISQGLRVSGLKVGLVPTMGSLHDGHLSLIRKARQENERVVVSIFVNPTQFGKGEDFSRYPRNSLRDSSLCRKEKVDFIFYPSAKKIYPEGYRTFVSVEGLSNILCGAFRPGHFRGVATVVAKLFNIIRPDVAYFGQKDAQQALIIKRMTEDLNIPVKIKVMPIVRQKNGLASSSRNKYLKPKEIKDAAVLFEALTKARQMVESGTREAGLIIREVKATIFKKKPIRIDYVAIVDSVNLRPVSRIRGKVLLALAVWFGRTRLIDNVILEA